VGVEISLSALRVLFAVSVLIKSKGVVFCAQLGGGDKGFLA